MRKSIYNKLKKFFHTSPTTKQELLETLRQSATNGVVDANSLAMLEGVLEVQDIRVSDVMVPRVQMVTLDYNIDLNSILPQVVQSGHSRFPVLGENKDEVLGIILAKDLLNYSVPNNEKKFNMQDILRRVVFIPESKRLNVLLQDFKVNRGHMAMVVDEYGRITGLITIEDVLEQIVGEIEDEYDTEESPNIKLQQDGGFAVKALTSVEEFNDYFDCSLDAEKVETIGGLVTRAFGHLPKRGESIKINGFFFTIIRADNRRVHLLNVIAESE